MSKSNIFYAYRGTVACLPHVISLRAGQLANGLIVPTLVEIGRGRCVGPCEYCAINALAELDEEACDLCGDGRHAQWDDGSWTCERAMYPACD